MPLVLLVPPLLVPIIREPGWNFFSTSAIQLLIFILATIITPTPDVLTLVAMSLPMCLLYESCIWIAWLMQRRALKAQRDGSHG
jgi:Sec-independent protein secretion pathway component TatC